MTGFQAVINIVLALLAFVFIQWLFSYVPTVPQVFVFAAAFVVAAIVFASNTAARLGVS